MLCIYVSLGGLCGFFLLSLLLLYLQVLLLWVVARTLITSTKNMMKSGKWSDWYDTTPNEHDDLQMLLITGVDAIAR